MRELIIILFLFIGVSSNAQTRTFVKKAEEIIQVKDVVSEIDETKPTSDEYDFLSSGINDLEGLFLGEVKSISHARPDVLQQSATLASLSELATESWKGSQYSDSKRWRKLGKYFKRAANRSTTRFNIMKEVSFRIQLVDDQSRKFYYDRKGASGALNLYAGRKPKSTSGMTDEELAKIEDPVALTFFSEEDLVRMFEKELRRKHLTTGLKRGIYSYVGISVEIDEKTLNRNRIPTARVVVILGARRLRNVKVKRPKN